MPKIMPYLLGKSACNEVRLSDLCILTELIPDFCSFAIRKKQWVDYDLSTIQVHLMGEYQKSGSLRGVVGTGTSFMLVEYGAP